MAYMDFLFSLYIFLCLIRFIFVRVSRFFCLLAVGHLYAFRFRLITLEFQMGSDFSEFVAQKRCIQVDFCLSLI